MPFKTKEEPPKTEMTSMIDMIFLLLIFFLVTLNPASKTVVQGEDIRVVKREITQPKDPGKPTSFRDVNMIIQVMDLPADSTRMYVAINQRNLNDIKLLAGSKRTSDLSFYLQEWVYKNPQFRTISFYDSRDLKNEIRTGNEVVICAPMMLPLSKVMSVYSAIAESGAKAYWGIGSFEDLKNVTQLPPSTDFVEYYY